MPDDNGLVEVPSLAIDSASVVLTLMVSAAPLISQSLVARPSNWCAAAIPLLGRHISSGIQKLASACEEFRVDREQAFVLAHGAVTYAVGDVIAQASKPADSSSKAKLWSPAQTGRAAVIGLVSDAYPFYHWSKFIASLDASTLPVVAAKPMLLLPLKILLHVATFQPLATAGYLFLQGLSKGDRTVRNAVVFLKAKFRAAIVPALATFTIGGPLVYSLPVVAGAALRNLGVLGFCIYLAVVSSQQS